MAGIDINSRFELSPGIKDIELINKLMSSIRNEES
jgi:phosphoribosylanthranilate isomerase